MFSCEERGSNARSEDEGDAPNSPMPGVEAGLAVIEVGEGAPGDAGEDADESAGWGDPFPVEACKECKGEGSNGK